MKTNVRSSPSLLAQSDLQAIKDIFPDEKLAKQVLNAAKRSLKKRPLPDHETTSPTKRKKQSLGEELMTPVAIEESLSLPRIAVNEETLRKTKVFSNRAPLVLAFCVVLLKNTMPAQPLSSRLSLAQAVVSVNSRSKAVSLGLEKGNSAEEDGLGQGQPKVKIMGRDIRVLKRWGYDSKEGTKIVNKNPNKDEGEEGNADLQESNVKEPALWGLDLEALRSSNKSAELRRRPEPNQDLPIYTAQSARSYLLKSFATAENETTSARTKKKSIKAAAAEKEHNLALLLSALENLYSSWSRVLSVEELDRRAWAWYVQVRPEVQNGVAGWGGKGEVRLADILDLCRKG